MKLEREEMQQQEASMSAAVGEVPPGSAMVYMPFQTRPNTYDRYKHRQSIGLGVTQILIGILCIIFNSVCLGVSYYASNGLGAVGHGYWCGVLVSTSSSCGNSSKSVAVDSFVPFLLDVFIQS